MKDYKKEGNIEGSLIIKGNLILTGDLTVEEEIDVTGCIDCNGYFIKAGGFIEAGYSIKAGDSIKAGGFIEAGGSIKAGGSIEAGDSIKAGGSIEAGYCYGIQAGLSIICKGTLSFGLKAFAGICTWKEITDEEKTITCSKLEGGGVVEYGILKETGESDTVEITVEGKTKCISRQSAEELNLI